MTRPQLRPERGPMSGGLMTALWTAALRGRESQRPDGLVTDRWAEQLAGPEGRALMERMEAEVPEAGAFRAAAARTRHLDTELIRLAAATDIEQLVLLGAGMDARAFRLPVPSTMVILEVDRPAILSLKEHRLDRSADQPRCRRTTVPTDVMSDELPAALTEAGFDPSRPSIWVAEGLFVYLCEEDVHRLLDVVGSMSAPGSWLLADLMAEAVLRSPTSARWRERMDDLGAPLLFGAADPLHLFGAHGWRATVEEPSTGGAYLITAVRA